MKRELSIQEIYTFKTIFNINSKAHFDYNNVCQELGNEFLSYERTCTISKLIINNNLSFIIDGVVDSLINHLYVELEISHKDNEAYIYGGKNDFFNILLNIKKMNLMHPEIYNADKITKEYLEKLFEKLIHPDLFNHYLYFKKHKVIGSVNIYDRIKTQSQLSNTNTKKYLNFLIDSLIETHNPLILEIINSKYNIIRVYDPLLKNIKIKELEKEISNSSYNKDSVTKDLVNQYLLLKEQNTKTDFMKNIDNVFQISLDIEKISFIKKDKNYGKRFISEIYKFFNTAKVDKIGFMESYISNKKDLDSIKAKNKIYHDSEIAHILKVFEFTYTDELDKQNKKKMLAEFFNASLNLSIPSSEIAQKEYEKILNTILFKHTLENNIPKKDAVKKTNKI